MKITHVCPAVDREANGLSKAVLDMTSSLARLGCEVELHTTGGAPPVAPPAAADAVSIHRYRSWSVATRLRVAPPLRKGLHAAAGRSDVIHSHGLWTFPPAYALQAALRAGIPSVVTAHGAFNPWPMSRSRLRKQVMWSVLHGPLFRRASCLHATSQDEVRQYRKMGLTSPVAVIPLGLDVPDTVPNREPRSPRRLLFLGRLHAKKGIDLLLTAWREVQHSASDWELHIVGPGDGAYVAHLREMASHLGCARVRFRESVYGAAKTREFFSADAFALTTYDENFGLAVAEALAHGVPALVTRGAPWSDLNSHGCGWWVDTDVRAIAEGLTELTRCDASELARMGMAGRRWMQEDFSAAAMARKLCDLYEWLLRGGAAPAFVHRS